MSKEFYKSNKFQIIISGSDEVHDVYINDKKAGTTKDSFELNSGDTIAIDFEGNWDVQEESYHPCHHETCEFEKERYGNCRCESEKKIEYVTGDGRENDTVLRGIISDIPINEEAKKYLDDLYEKHVNRKAFPEKIPDYSDVKMTQTFEELIYGLEDNLDQDFPYELKEERKNYKFEGSAGDEIYKIYKKHGINADASFKLFGKKWNLDFTTLKIEKEVVSIDFVRVYPDFNKPKDFKE